ncbi:MAG: hypothetical protein QNK37_31360 [Acidobacteriota bacterium]|nr:hypothetical protein [Acidobacteriota bacterium]
MLQAQLLSALRMLSKADDRNGEETTSSLFEAIDFLKSAPLTESVSRSLLMGLRAGNKDVVERTIEACIHRLGRFENETEKGVYIGLVLEACFLNLSGRSLSRFEEPGGDENRRINASEDAAARLFRAVTRELLENPLEHDHHIARILARSKQIERMEGTGALAREVIQFQKALSTNVDRIYHADANELRRLRRENVYLSPKSSEEALTAYLEEDSSLSLTEVPQTLCRIYRMMIHVQKRKRPWLHAVQNLISWLESLPEPGSDPWRQQFEQMIGPARIGESWGQLDLFTLRHLEFQLEFLPGSGHGEDFLELLRREYAAPELEDELITGLELMRHLPIIRDRIDDLEGFLLDQGKKQRSIRVWTAFIGLLETHVTGLEPIVLTRAGELDADEKRRLRLLSRTLDRDDRMRQFLYKLATDRTGQWSNQPAVDEQVRQMAWRVLLRCLPGNRRTYFREGLLDHDGCFFMATMEESARLRQRGLWSVIEDNWDRLFGPDVPGQTRIRRMESLAHWFETGKVFEGVQHNGTEIGRILELALDGEFSLVDRFRQAVINAGYELELRRELQRREIMSNREHLTQNNEEIIRLEDQEHQLTSRTLDTEKSKADLILSAQDDIVARERMITTGWLRTSRFQVDMEEVREQLAATLARAAAEYESLQQLQRRMRSELARSEQLRDRIANLVSRQEYYESEIVRLERRVANAENEAARAETSRQRAASRLSSLRSPSSPRLSGDPEQDRRLRDRYAREVRQFESEQRDLANTIQRCESQISRLHAEIRQCRSAIQDARNNIAALQQEIDRERRNIAAIERAVDAIAASFRAGRSRWEALRSEIRRLESEVDTIGARHNRESDRARNELQDNTRHLEAVQSSLDRKHRRLQGLSHELNQTGENKDRHVTISQELVHAIDSGRVNYDALSNQARPASAAANDDGHSRQVNEEMLLREQQEAHALYSHAAREALNRTDQPPTRDQYQTEKTAKRRRSNA